ncbi:MAG: glycerol kinase GlpK [Polyangia bacterium]
MSEHILAIDQGTTSTRAIVFARDGSAAGVAQRELTQRFPADGRVEHDAEEIWSSTLEVCRAALAEAGLAAGDVAAIGITNQRETAVVWERAGGRPIGPAIVWQDRRTAGRCAELASRGAGELVAERTGLLLDPYFSATKIAWILDETPGARARAERGELACGTIDSFLLWRLSGGESHATDASNASRTSLFDIRAQRWDDELLELFGVPRELLPRVFDSAAQFGQTRPDLLGAAIPITGVAGDQQAALVGQACFEPGTIKSTYGTGGFAIANTGSEIVRSSHRLLSTVSYRLEGRVVYGLEGSIFAAGSAIQWLRDGLGLIESAGDSERLARWAGAEHGVYLVPAFTGLGAPHWDPAARGALLGLTRDTGIEQVVAAGLQAAAYQTRDLLEAMLSDGAARPPALRVDGGMVANDWMVQFLADLLDLPVDRPAAVETTALGAAFLAGLQAGIYESTAEIAKRWEARPRRRFEPRMDPALRERLYRGWSEAVAKVTSANALLENELRKPS